MMRFSDMNIDIDAGKNIYPVPQVSISDILNEEIEVLGYQAGVKTQHGDGRYVVLVRHNKTEYKFFTTAQFIREALDKVPKESFPFLTTIRAKKVGTGSGRMFYFT